MPSDSSCGQREPEQHSARALDRYRRDPSPFRRVQCARTGRLESREVSGQRALGARRDPDPGPQSHVAGGSDSWDRRRARERDRRWGDHGRSRTYRSISSRGVYERNGRPLPRRAQRAASGGPPLDLCPESTTGCTLPPRRHDGAVGDRGSNVSRLCRNTNPTSLPKGRPSTDIADEIGLGKRFTQCGLRRTFNDLPRVAQVNDVVTRSISGHLTSRMQDHYSTPAAEEKREGIARVIELARHRPALASAADPKGVPRAGGGAPTAISGALNEKADEVMSSIGRTS